MQAVTPIDVHVENEWHDSRHNGSYVKKSTSTVNRGGRQAIRMRTCVTNKTRPSKTKSLHIPQQVVQPKQVLPARSRSPSPNREPWVPPPGRSTKGQKFAWQSSKARLEINPVIDGLVNDDVDGESSQNTERNKQNLHNQTANISAEQDEKLQEEIRTYEKRIQALIENVGMLKERARSRTNQEQTDQLRSDINSCLRDLEQSQKICNQRTNNILSSRISRSSSPIRNNYRSSSADEKRSHRLLPKVSFEDDPIIERRRARSTTPIRGPLYLNPDRERLLISLSDSEADSRLNAKTHELASMNKQINLTQTDIKAREDSFGSKERVFQQRINDLEQQISKLRLECTQLKREKDELERRYTSQLGELRDRLEQSNNNNRSMQNYVNSLKTTYATVFNDTLPPPFTTTSFTRFTTTPNVYP
ncbi:unnamed protein product [Rotaria sp. Silwood1]|nr:unnamed protein product [Rotaria sp. Silwood1]